MRLWRGPGPEGEGGIVATLAAAGVPRDVLVPPEDVSVFAWLVRDEALSSCPTWCIDPLGAGPARSSAGYDTLLLQTSGSSYDWSDEVRFDNDTGLLVSLMVGSIDLTSSGSF